MFGRWRDAIDGARQLIGGGDPRQLVDSTIELMMALCRARRGAAFSVDGERLGLAASRGIDQEALNLVQAVWTGPQRRSLYTGPFYSAGPESFVVAGCFDGEDLAGLLYADTPETSFRLPEAHLSTFCSILAEGLRSLAEPSAPRPSEWETFLERTSPEEIERDRLLLLLNRNEWNISRVSRLLGVTRMTIYNRLDRFKIPREHVPKVTRRPLKA